MKSKKRLTLIVLTIMAMIACLIGAVACGGSEADVIDMYILPQNETLVDSDFSLPKTIGADGAVAVTWTSSNTDAIAIEDNGGEEYTAKVTLQAEVTPVTLTIASGKATKDFTVRVDALNVFTFINHFTFAQEKTSVTEDFDLVTSTTFAGQSATITWEVEDKASKSYIEVQNGNKVHITPDYDLVDVKIKANFSYKNDSAPQSYTFSVSPEFDALQKVNRMYSQADYPLEISGYIVHAYEVSESYGNATMYVVSDDFSYGYYLYRAKINTADVAKYVDGAHVKYSGGTAKNYNGLWENNSNGTVVIDDSKPAINPRDHIYAMDTDYLADVPSLLWRESTLVSLTGWKVTKEKVEKPTGADADLFKLTKNNQTITVRISKYVKRTDDQLTALCNVYDSVSDGDIVDVVGILGNYRDAFQIQPILASDITKKTAADETTNEDGAKLKAAVKAVSDAVKTNIGSIVAANKEFTMPTESNGVAISYKLTPSSLSADKRTVAIDGGKFTVTPTTSEKNYDIQVTYKLGEKEYYSFFKLRNWKLTAQQIVDTVEGYAKKEKVTNITSSGEITLPAIDSLGTTLTWSVKGEMPAWLKISGSTATVSQLPEFESELIFVVTISLDGATSKSYEYKAVKVSARDNVTFTAVEGEIKAGDYVLSVMNKGTRLYATGKMDGSYLATTSDNTKAGTFTLEKKDDSWLIKIGKQYLEVNPYDNTNSGKVSYSLRLVDTATANAVWKWNETIKTFTQVPVAGEGVTGEVSTSEFYIGMRDDSDYTTISPSEIKYITGENASKLDVTQHPARLGETKKGPDKTDQDKIAAALADVKDAYTVEVAGDWLLPTCKVNGVKFAWAISGTSSYRLTTEKTALAINELPASAATVTLTVTATIEGKTVTDNTKTVTVTIQKAVTVNYGTVEKPLTVAEAIALAATIDGNGFLGGKDNPIQVVVKGIVIDAGEFKSDKGNWQNAYFADTADASKSDKTKAAQIYRLEPDGTFLKADGDLVVGAEITIRGWLQVFNGTAEVSHNGGSENCKAVAYKAPEGGGTGGGTGGGETPTPGGDQPGTESHATLTFDDTTKRTTGTTSEQVWTENGVTLTNNNGSVNTKYFNPVRLYKGTTIKIEYGTAIAKIVFHSSENFTDDSGKTTPYCDYLKESLEALTGVTVTADGTTITVVLATPTKAFEFTASAGQCRLLSLEVFTDAGSGSTDPGEGGGTSSGEDPGEPDTSLKATYNPSYENQTVVTSEKIGDNITLTFTTGATTAATYYTNGTALRLYPGNLLTFKAAEGYKIVKIEFTFGTSDKSNPILASNGTMEAGVWTGQSSSVMLMIGGVADNRRVTSIVISYEETTHVHSYGTFAHDANKATHSATCTAADCYEEKLTQYCFAEASVCKDCSHSYTIADMSAASTGTKSFLLGTYSVTGTVKSITTEYTSDKGVTFVVTVGEVDITVYGYKGTDAANIAVGNNVTVTGHFEDYNGTPEFPNYQTTVTINTAAAAAMLPGKQLNA